MTEDQVAEVFSAPAGDYAPGTSSLHAQWGWVQLGHMASGMFLTSEGMPRGTGHMKEWRSEKGRVVVEFDSQSKVVTAAYYRAGRNPITNVAERLKWDHERFERLLKYVEKRRVGRREEGVADWRGGRSRRCHTARSQGKSLLGSTGRGSIERLIVNISLYDVGGRGDDRACRWPESGGDTTGNPWWTVWGCGTGRGHR